MEIQCRKGDFKEVFSGYTREYGQLDHLLEMSTFMNVVQNKTRNT